MRITGASSGFGIDYAHIMAKLGMNLIITARRTEKLKTLKTTITKEYGVQVLVETLDLSLADASLKLAENLKIKNIEIEVLINNAGYGIYGEFVDEEWHETQKMLQVDIIALTQLTKVFSDQMVLRGSGYILLVAAIGGYQPTPTYATYGAAKAYVLNFGEALSYELKNKGIKVSVLSPGITATDFLKVSGQKATVYQRIFMVQSYPVALIGIKAMLNGDHVGNANYFTKSKLILQKEEYVAGFGKDVKKFGYNPNFYNKVRENVVLKLNGDYDLFSDGSVIIKRAAGHTPGHQVLFLNLPETGPILLSGDLYHFRKNRSFNFNKFQTLQSMYRIENFVKDKNAQFWIQHDPDRRKETQLAPKFYQ